MKADVHEFLTSGNTRFDVMVALDVLIYVGETDSLLKAAAARCDLAALIILSTETFDGEGFTLLPSGGYAHADSYVDACAMRHGLKSNNVSRPLSGLSRGSLSPDNSTFSSSHNNPPGDREDLGGSHPTVGKREAQILIVTPLRSGATTPRSGVR